MCEIDSSLSKLAKYEQNKQIKSVDTCFLWPNSYRIDLTYSNILDLLEVEMQTSNSLELNMRDRHGLSKNNHATLRTLFKNLVCTYSSFPSKSKNANIKLDPRAEYARET